MDDLERLIRLDERLKVGLTVPDLIGIVHWIVKYLIRQERKNNTI